MPTSCHLLEHTFLHLPRIGRKTEWKLWMDGVATWSDLRSKHHQQLSLFGSDAWTQLLDASHEALTRGDADFFAQRLPRREHYRIAATFPAETAFLDIETTGLSLYYDTITLIGLSKGRQYACRFGQPRTETNDCESWRDLLNEAKCLVTFNGTIFDLRFLEKHLPHLQLPAAHVDLRFLARRVSLTGGQKAIEEAVRVERPAGVNEVTGREAALLWYDYAAGSRAAGKRLVRYNHADVEGMKVIFDQVLDRLLASDFPPALSIQRPAFSKSRSRISFAPTPSTIGNSIHIPRYPRRLCPTLNYASLAPQGQASPLRIIGIDLTGSERRASGWCLLHGCRAVTRVLRTDHQLIEETAVVKPHLVSIDSPLSLPTGRHSATDDDPARSKYGITRECERTLRARGIHVYPCLIPSMQMLTRRGIALSRQLRSLGIPVIESYPGAAQDIMNIPRKRAGMDRLKDGLRQFGIQGSFLSEPVTHDEVDAVTAAVVGLFFWQGRFEALGNETEDYLIIPELRNRTARGRKRRIVGVSGFIAAGKTTAAKHLATKGFAYGRYSQLLAEISGRDGGTVDRPTLQQLGSRIHLDPGQRWLNQQLLSALAPDSDIVIDGIRWPEDHAFWAERCGPGFLHLHIKAPGPLRQQRFVRDGFTAEEFATASRHESEKGTHFLESVSTLTIQNEEALSTFKRSVSKAASRYYKGGP